MKKYALKLDLPVQIDMRELAVRPCNQDVLQHFAQPIETLPELLVQYLDSLGLIVQHCEVFVTPKKCRLPIHIDGDKPSDIVKLNWQYGAGGSCMNWFEPIDPNEPMTQKFTGVGTRYLQLSPTLCRMVYSAKIGTPSLVNVGRLHSVVNPTNETRWVISVVPCHRNRAPLEWKDAVEIFKTTR